MSKEPIDLANSLLNIMRECATRNGGPGYSLVKSESSYALARNQLMQLENGVQSLVPQVVRNCETLGQFWGFIQSEYDRYTERREYLKKEFDPLLSYLERRSTSPLGPVHTKRFGHVIIHV